MKIVAIVAEYNPFHYGHLHQIETIRKTFGEDTAIIAVMSGNYTQRGELALMNKVERAKCALACGVNLVLELPFPYSMSSAEHFANAAVHIIDSLGVVDVLSFGSECGSLEILKTACKRLNQPEFLSRRQNLIHQNKKIGYASANETVYRELYGEDGFVFSSNNILSLMYLQALDRLNSNILSHTLKRVGNAYNDISLDSRIASASAIREGIYKNTEGVFDYCPLPVKKHLMDAMEKGDLLLSISRLDSAVLSHLLLNTSSSCPVHEGEDGLYNRLLKSVQKASSIPDLITLSETKKYTTARIRRVLWNSIIGVTSSNVKTLPCFTQLLASDSLGQAILKRTKKTAKIQILTKPTRYDKQNLLLKSQVEMSHKMDMLYAIALGHPSSEALTYTPFIKVD